MSILGLKRLFFGSPHENEEKVLKGGSMTAGSSVVPPSYSDAVANHSSSINKFSTSSAKDEIESRNGLYVCEFKGERVRIPANVPDFIIIGAPKAGTLALREFFEALPLFEPSTKREPHFFDREKLKRAEDMDDQDACAARHRYVKTVFRNVHRTDVVHFEKTPGYMRGVDVAAKVKRILGFHVKILVSLRNPIDRSYSAYKMYWRLGHMGHHPTPSSFDDQVRADIEELRSRGLTNAPPLDLFDPDDADQDFELTLSFKERAEYSPPGLRPGLYTGMYAMHLAKWTRRFPYFKAVRFEELHTRQATIVKDLLDFLGYPDQGQYLDSEQMKTPVKSTSTPQGVEPMSNRTRDYLQRFYRPYNEELADLLGEQWRGVWD